ncbi:hypothetical protein Adt_31875 [Abeliophyllum distichum]|uniref:Uncharacterized protein n=1 Tax=Abeliophyllum distichum TaxID=126358 RepID=A0ABD1RJ34_9LAMI
MGAQAVKKYFNPKWEEFSSHGELEDVLEASLASTIRASAMQLKVLGEFRTQGYCRGSGGCNKEKRCLLDEAKSCDKEIQSLRKDLESSENGRKEAEAGRKEGRKWRRNWIGQQEVLTAIRNDHPDFDIASLEARFPPPDV